MKKILAITLVIVLALSILAACGGGKGGGDETLSRPESGDDSPLSRDDPNDNGSSEGAGASDSGIDMSAVLSGNGGAALISSYDEATKQSFVAQANADGYDVTFGADGSTRIEHRETGEIMIQNADGTWSFGEDGTLQMGGDWPDNEFTKQVPKPDFAISLAGGEGGSFGITFIDASIEQIKAYVEKVKAAGFTINPETEDMEVSGMVIYSYTAQNADGYIVNVFSASGMTGMSIEKY